MSTVNQLILFVAVFVFGGTAVMDLRQRRIPNELVLAVIALSLIHMASSRDVTTAVNDVKWAGLVLIGSLAFWARRWLGGGDVKLIFAASLLVGAQALPDFLVLTVLFGGVLGGLAFGDMWLEKYYGWSAGLAFPRVDLAVRSSATTVPRKAAVPYGIAISLACVATLLTTSSAIW